MQAQPDYQRKIPLTEGKVMLAARKSLPLHITCDNGTRVNGDAGLRKPNKMCMDLRSWELGGRKMYYAEVEATICASDGSNMQAAAGATHSWDPAAGDRCTGVVAAGGGSQRNVNACIWAGPADICYVILRKHSSREMKVDKSRV